MEMVVIDAGSKLLNAGPTIPEKALSLIIPTEMKRMQEDELIPDSTLVEDITVNPVERGFIRDWDAMEDLLQHVLYACLGWKMGNEQKILFTVPLCTPMVITIGNKRYVIAAVFFGYLLPTGFEDRFQDEASLCVSSIRPSLVKPPDYMP